jgi:nicotinate phosphoribosyltransferase
MDEIIEELKHVCTLRFTEDELEFIKKRNPFFSDAYIEFLRNLQLNYDYMDIREENGQLYIGTKPNSPLIYTTWFELYVLPIVQEVYTRNVYPNVDYSEGKRILDENIKKAKTYYEHVARFSIADFGHRRRFNAYWQDYVLQAMTTGLSSDCFVGTSSMYFAKKYDIKDIGTFAHEYLAIGQSIDNVTLLKSQSYMFQKWADTYRGEMGIALSDLLGFDAFLRDFDKYFCKLYDGIRIDSGVPQDVGNAMIEHYKKMRIDPNTKTLVFSDGIDFDSMLELVAYFRGRINVSFGIGTKLVNNLGADYKALQLVMKLIRVNGKPVAKVADSPGKGMCEDEEYLKYLKKVFQITD